MPSARASRRRRASYFAQPYVQAIERARLAGAIPTTPGTVGILEVAHDGWCPKLSGGECCCRPTLSIRYPRVA